MLNFFFLKTLKGLSKGKLSKGGRNFLGRVCVIGRSFLKRKIYIKVDIFRRINSLGSICKIVYDTNRSIKVGFIVYFNGLTSFIGLSEGLKIGDFVYSGGEPKGFKKFLKGDALPLKFLNLFSVLNNIELKPFKGAQLVRAGGGSCVFIGKKFDKGILKLSSGWQVSVPLACISTIGVASCKGGTKNLGKAGKMRNLGFKPKVRGVAKNPCDHPHGGGNGKRSKPPVAVNFKGSVFKWRPTTNKKKDRLKRRYFKNLI
jgi:large subunit ribosomal protein L2